MNFPLSTYSVCRQENVSHANKNILETPQDGGCCPLFRTVTVSWRFGLRSFTGCRNLLLEFVAYVLGGAPSSHSSDEPGFVASVPTDSKTYFAGGAGLAW